MPEVFKLGPFLLPAVRLFLIAGLLLASWWAARSARKAGLDGSWAGNVAGNAALYGLVGARLGFVLQNGAAYREALYLWQLGYLPWAGVLGGVLYLVWALWRKPAAERPSYLRPLAYGFRLGAGLLLGLALAPFSLGRDLHASDICGGSLRGMPVLLVSGSPYLIGVGCCGWEVTLKAAIRGALHP